MNRSVSWALGACGVLALAGCGGDDASAGSGAAEVSFPASTSCGLALDTSGELAVHLGASSPVACLTQQSSGSGIDNGFLPTGDEQDLEAAQITLRMVHEGETGGPFLTTLALRHHDKRIWQSEQCQTSISKHADLGPVQFGESYRVEGTITCPTLQVRGDAGAGVEIHGLSFVTTVTWTK